MIDIERLRELASKATPGKRIFYSDGEISRELPNEDGHVVLLPEPSAIRDEFSRIYDAEDLAGKQEMTANHRLFAALDPETVIALLDRLGAVEADAAELRVLDAEGWEGARLLTAENEKLKQRLEAAERIYKEAPRLIQELEYAAHGLCEEKESDISGVVESTCPKRTLLISIRDMRMLIKEPSHEND
ncbi:MAG TPA: ead/Ea22-like family protein [Modicisalibacter sp.]|nr:ead/Ea22-like family protein [Modicisalibacter sp.]